jgi:ABC-type bacteriocin/lantibiotic exporter with double-glycine peptidase domain
VLRRPDVLPLDESTSALDVETRERVIDNLLEEFKNRILVFVTHDEFVTSKVDIIPEMRQLNAAVTPDERAEASPA